MKWGLITLMLGTALAESPGDNIGIRLQTFSAQPPKSIGGEPLHVPQNVARFYRSRSHRPAWLRPNAALDENAQALMKAIRETEEHGLSPRSYHLEALEKLLSPEKEPTLDRLLQAEVLLSDAFLALGEHLFTGRLDPSELDADLGIRRRSVDLVKKLSDSLREGIIARTLEELAPRDKRYQKLKAKLAAYRALDADGAFPTVDKGAELRRGARGERVAQLRARLAREGYLESWNAPSLVFDEEAEKALKAFQASRGLETTGTLGTTTVNALNLPISRIVAQIEANLERLRWLPRQLGGKYLFVDIAEFRLVAFESGRPVLSMKIIVGNDYRRTPMLSTKLTSVVLNPYWTIPKSILAEEILPRARQSSSYLAKRNIRVLEDGGGARREIDPAAIDWSEVRWDGHPYLFKEPSGPRNPLGNIKFVLKNNYSVYLHGTPDVRLFNRAQRALSHGCIRVENPLKLATYLLKGGSPVLSKSAIEEEIEEGLEVSIPLASPVPIYLWYRTAWVDQNGVLQLRRDLYGWDDLLGNALGTKD